MEHRTAIAPQVEERESGKPLITGYAAVFHRDGDPGTEYEIFPGLVEQLSRTAFSRALKDRDDVRALFNHDAQKILGRVSAGTLRLNVDDRGLRYEIDPPETQYSRDLITSIRRGDVDGSSFAFTARSEHLRAEEARDVRVLEDVNLYDVGPVTYPAYKSSTTGLRSECLEPELYEQWQKWRELRAERKAMVEQRLREIKLDGYR